MTSYYYSVVSSAVRLFHSHAAHPEFPLQANFESTFAQSKRKVFASVVVLYHVLIVEVILSLLPSSVQTLLSIYQNHLSMRIGHCGKKDEEAGGNKLSTKYLFHFVETISHFCDATILSKCTSIQEIPHCPMLLHFHTTLLNDFAFSKKVSSQNTNDSMIICLSHRRFIVRESSSRSLILCD